MKRKKLHLNSCVSSAMAFQQKRKRTNWWKFCVDMKVFFFCYVLKEKLHNFWEKSFFMCLLSLLATTIQLFVTFSCIDVSGCNFSSTLHDKFEYRTFGFLIKIQSLECLKSHQCGWKPFSSTFKPSKLCEQFRCIKQQSCKVSRKFSKKSRIKVSLQKKLAELQARRKWPNFKLSSLFMIRSQSFKFLQSSPTIIMLRDIS